MVNYSFTQMKALFRAKYIEYCNHYTSATDPQYFTKIQNYQNILQVLHSDYTTDPNPVSGNGNAFVSSYMGLFVDMLPISKWAGIATKEACSLIFCDEAFEDMPGDTILNYIIVTDRESYEKNPYSYNGGAVYAEFSFDSNGKIKRFTIEDAGLVSVVDR